MYNVHSDLPWRAYDVVDGSYYLHEKTDRTDFYYWVCERTLNIDRYC